MRQAPGVKSDVVRLQLDRASREFAERFDQLIVLADDRRELARDWQELGWHLAGVTLVRLRASSWEALANRLVNRLASRATSRTPTHR